LPGAYELERFPTVAAKKDVAASTQSQVSNATERLKPPCLPIWDSLDKLAEGPINFGRRSSQNSTLQNSLAVKSSDQSWLAQKLPLLRQRVRQTMTLMKRNGILTGLTGWTG